MQAVGRLVKSANGFVADVSSTYVSSMIQDSGRREGMSGDVLGSERLPGNPSDSTWVPIFRLERLPRLLNFGVGRRRQGRRLPWTKMR